MRLFGHCARKGRTGRKWIRIFVNTAVEGIGNIEISFWIDRDAFWGPELARYNRGKVGLAKHQICRLTVLERSLVEPPQNTIIIRIGDVEVCGWAAAVDRELIRTGEASCVQEVYQRLGKVVLA